MRSNNVCKLLHIHKAVKVPATTYQNLSDFAY